MAGSFTDTAEAAVLEALFRSAALSTIRKATFYVALFTGDPLETGLGPEVIGGGYARQPITTTDASWAAPAAMAGGRGISNANTITYGTPSGDWSSGASITHWALFDAVTGGVMWVTGTIDGTTRPVLLGDDPVQFAAGSLSIPLVGIAGGFSTYLRDALLNHMFRTTLLTKPGNLYWTLYNGDPAVSGTELTGTGYARVAQGIVDASWTPAATDGTDKSITNAASLTFPAVGGAWGTYTHAAAMDAASAGNRWLSGTLGTSRTIAINDQSPNWPVGALKLQLG